MAAMQHVKAPHMAMIIGRKSEGRDLTRIMLLGASNKLSHAVSTCKIPIRSFAYTYVMKKTTRHIEYSLLLNSRSSAIPAIFALPMLVRS